MASLPQSVARGLAARYKDWVDPVYGWDREIVGYDLNDVPPRDDLATASAMVKRCLMPATEREIKAELTRLKASTKSRAEDEDEMALGFQVYLEECSLYPDDILRGALRGLGRRVKFYPSLSEVLEELQRTARRRLGLHSCVSAALDEFSRGKQQTEAAWQYLRERIGADAFYRWFNDVELKSVTDGIVTLVAKSGFSVSFIKQNFTVDLWAAWQRADPTIKHVDISAKR